jgi:4-hydroxy-3-polyprenylbenzoate decarboxylase
MDMAYTDLREWLNTVDKQGELLRLSGVSHDLEMAGIAEILVREGKQPPPAILYDDIPDHPPGYRTLFGMFSSPRRLAMCLDLPPCELDPVSLTRNWRQKRRELRFMPPKAVRSGPVQDHVLTGKDVDLLTFPSPRFHEFDGGRYFGTGHCVITRDPESGWVNLGTYRIMLVDRDRLAIHMLPTQQGDIMFNTYMAEKQPMPVAIAVGVDPALLFASITRIPWGLSEYDFAGGIRGEPIEVINGPYTGLPIPAWAEIVIEGECLPGELIDEGPFGEWHGYYANLGLEPVPEPVVRVKTVLYRDDPILTCMHGGKPPHDYTLARCVTQSVMIWDALESCSVPGVAGIWCHEAGAGSLLSVVSLRTAYAGHARQAGVIASQIPQSLGRYTIVVDDDVDPCNLQEVMWAVVTRADPERAIEILHYCRSNSADTTIPMQNKRQSKTLYNSRAIIDACRPYEWKHEFAPIVQVTPEFRSHLLKKWETVFKAHM